MHKLTPESYLYMLLMKQYINRMQKEPDKHEQSEMYARAIYDYKHASTHDKLILERQVESLNKQHHHNQNIRVELVSGESAEDIGGFGKHKKKKRKVKR